MSVRAVARRRILGARISIVDRWGHARADPLFVLGNQKSGTTAVARLIAEATGRTYSHDMFYRRQWSDVADLHSGRLSVDDLVRRSSWEFSREVIKDPDLTFHHLALQARFPAARFLFVARGPADNIRSLLNRHRFPGDVTDRCAEARLTERLSPLWQAVFDPRPLGLAGGNYIDVLAQRWTLAADTYLSHPESQLLLRYEDFLADKLGTIERSATELQMPIRADVSARLEEQFQVKGDNSTPVQEFFGPDNYARIRRWCQDAAGRLDYSFDG